MPEWWIEQGIGESRAVLIEDGQIIEARIEMEGLVRAGSVVAARLIDKGRNARNAVARDVADHEYLLPRAAGSVAEGAKLAVEVTRERIPGSEPWKRAIGRISSDEPRPSAALEAELLPFPAAEDALAGAGWNELVDEAREGIVRFAGGELRISVTPAMTLIDVDGHLSADELAIRGAGEAARAVRRLDIGGSIGIDVPSAGSKAARQEAGKAIDRHLPLPFERTAVNGFGFVQIVRPRLRASLVELAQDAAAFEARALLRRAALEPPGPKRLVAHPAVLAAIRDAGDWTERLSRQVGGEIGLRADAALPMSAGYAESA